jgi:hypothetical protein
MSNCTLRDVWSPLGRDVVVEKRVSRQTGVSAATNGSDGDPRFVEQGENFVLNALCSPIKPTARPAMSGSTVGARRPYADVAVTGVVPGNESWRLWFLVHAHLRPSPRRSSMRVQLIVTDHGCRMVIGPGLLGSDGRPRADIAALHGRNSTLPPRSSNDAQCRDGNR